MSGQKPDTAGIKIEAVPELPKYKKELIQVYLSAYERIKRYSYTKRRDVEQYLGWLYRRDVEGFAVALVERNILGFIACDSNWFSNFEGEYVGEIHEIVIRSNYQGRGYGKLLLAWGEKYLKNKGRRKIELWVGEQNEQAKQFYRKAGFIDKGTINGWTRMIKLF